MYSNKYKLYGNFFMPDFFFKKKKTIVITNEPAIISTKNEFKLDIGIFIHSTIEFITACLKPDENSAGIEESSIFDIKEGL